MPRASLSWAPPFYFLFYAAAAGMVPYLVIYYQDLGLTGAQIGFLAGIPPLVSLFGAPSWGVIADVTRRHKASLLVAVGGAVLLALVFSVTRTFAWLIPLVALFAFFISPIMPLVDNTTLGILGGQKERYGRIRVWGAIGWGVAAPVVGWFIQVSGSGWMFWSYAVLMGLGFLIALGIPLGSQKSDAARAGMRYFLSNPRWLVFLVIAFCGGMALSMISNFLFLFLSSLQADEALLGISLTFATLSEIPVLFFSDRLLRRWSASRLMKAAIIFFALRALAYSFIGAPWLALPIQLLHGPTFSLMWLSGVSYADEISPAGMGATAQGLFSGVMLGVGSAAGAFLGGLLYDYFGLLSLFRLAALIALLALVFMMIAEKRIHERPV